jgi:hypothetical protein
LHKFEFFIDMQSHVTFGFKVFTDLAIHIYNCYAQVVPNVKKKKLMNKEMVVLFNSKFVCFFWGN